MNCIEEPTSEQGGLFLGDVISLMKADLISQAQITAVLSCMTEFSSYGFYLEHPVKLSPTITHSQIPAKDVMDYPLDVHFD